METKLFDSELTIMSIIWEEGDITAKEIAEIAKKRVNWSKTTTYTVIKKCIEKGAIERSDPNYICHALISKEEVQQLAHLFFHHILCQLILLFQIAVLLP